MVMPHELARLISRIGEAQSIDRTVQPSLQEREKNFSGDPFLPIGFGKDVAKLILQYAVHPFDFLFFPELGTIRGKLFPRLTMLSRRVGPPVNGALLRVAPLPFEKEFEVFPPTKPTD
jgi:hypothetical protein